VNQLFKLVQIYKSVLTLTKKLMKIDYCSQVDIETLSRNSGLRLGVPWSLICE